MHRRVMRREGIGLRRHPATERSLEMGVEPLKTRTSTRDQHSNLLRGSHSPVRSCSSRPSSGVVQARRSGEAMPDFTIERQGKGLVCGIDEAGRGPLAGPVVAAAVILQPRRFPRLLRDELDDSKVLTRQQREACYGALRRCVDRGAACVGIGAVSAPEIDRLNILRAALLAMARAVAVLGVHPDTALVDGVIAPPLACAVNTVV